MSAGVIGKGIRIKGKLAAGEDLCIHGAVEGTIALTDNHLTLESSSVIDAHLTVRQATFKGTLRGNSQVSEKVTVDAGAEVRGDIETPVLIIEDGARFRGAITMQVDIPADLLEGAGEAARAVANTTSQSNTGDNA